MLIANAVAGQSAFTWPSAEARRAAHRIVQLQPGRVHAADHLATAQRLLLEPDLVVATNCEKAGLRLDLATRMTEAVECRTEVRARSDEDGWLVIAVRPYNPEGIQFIHHQIGRAHV